MNVKMGYAYADITPEGSMELIGFSRANNYSKGILHRLKAQVSVWITDYEICCFIAIDSLGFTTELCNKLRYKVAEKLKTSLFKVMVCFSHTHSAPNAGNNNIYYEFVCEQIMLAVSQAVLNLSKVNAALGVGKCLIGINRRGNYEAVDDRIGILKVTDSKSDKIKLLILRVTAHANVLSSDNYLISSDYFGVTRELLQQKYGCNVMIVQGASGDVRPKYQQDNAEYIEIHSCDNLQYSYEDKQKYFKQSISALNSMANQIYKSVDSVIKEIVPHAINNLAMFSVNSRFAADVPYIDYANKIAYEAKIIAKIDGTDWLKEVKRLNEQNIRQQFSDVEIQYFCIDNGCICGVPNEVMCEISIDIMKKAKNELLLFGGYTNGCNSYLPTPEEYDKGGYEVLWSNLIYYKCHGRVMPFNRDTAVILTDDVVKHWNIFCSKKL